MQPQNHNGRLATPFLCSHPHLLVMFHCIGTSQDTSRAVPKQEVRDSLCNHNQGPHLPMPPHFRDPARSYPPRFPNPKLLNHQPLKPQPQSFKPDQGALTMRLRRCQGKGVAPAISVGLCDQQLVLLRREARKPDCPRSPRATPGLQENSTSFPGHRQVSGIS